MGQWHYNMGLVQARLENWVESRFHFLSAEKSGLRSVDVEQNSRLVLEKLELSKAEAPMSISDHILRTTKFLSGGELTTLSLVIVFAGILSLKKKMTPWKLTLVVICSIGPLAVSWGVNALPEAVVMSEAKIQEGPSQIFGAITDAPAGLRVIIDGEGDWRRVIYPSRFRGWIKKSFLKELE